MHQSLSFLLSTFRTFSFFFVLGGIRLSAPDRMDRLPALLELVQEHLVIQEKCPSFGMNEKKAWEELAACFNDRNPKQTKRSTKQPRKRCFKKLTVALSNYHSFFIKSGQLKYTFQLYLDNIPLFILQLDAVCWFHPNLRVLE